MTSLNFPSESSPRETDQKTKKKMASAEEPDAMGLLRQQCLKRGAAGIKGIGRSFRICDDNGNKQLSEEEFRYGLQDFGVTDLTNAELSELFNYVDVDGTGQLSVDEFLIALRGDMPQPRIDVVNKAFKKLDVTGDGLVTVEDLERVYSVSQHPKYLSGEWTKKQCLKAYLDTFQLDGDSKVTHEEFLNYYAGVSASIDMDVQFDLMMRNAWKL